MGNPRAFLTVPRKEAGYRPVRDRIHDFSEVEQTLNTRDRQEQASRCMDCGVPFCHWACPLGNKDPEWNDALYRGEWEAAYKILKKTNDFPEFTGRICPALCEKACVLYLTTGEAVTNRENEAAIAERAYVEGYVTIEHPVRNGRRVAVIGAGPAGLAAANQLNYKGYEVTVFDRNEAAGGLLRYGIPNFKLQKSIIDRRIKVMMEEGVKFVYDTAIDLLQLSRKRFEGPNAVLEGFDAYVVATGTPEARDINVPGRELQGIHLALDLLSQQNRVLAGWEVGKNERVTAKNKRVLVIGGGDTGSDCIGTAHRQGCRSVTQIEIMPKPPVGHNPATPWPGWPVILKTTSSHEEGCERRWLLNTNRFIDDGHGHVKGVEVEGVIWEHPSPQSGGTRGAGRPTMKLDGKKEIIDCDIVFLAMGFLRPQQPFFDEEGRKRPECANVFLAGDAASGASLVVRAIASGRKTAEAVDAFLRGV